MRRLAWILIAGAALGGCQTGYLHKHVHECPNGEGGSHRHYHPADGRGGHHIPAADPVHHREMGWGA